MTKKNARELLMDYLYDEISKADKQKLKAYLADHPKLQQELDELRETQSLLQQMPDVAPVEKLLMMEPQESGWRNNIRRLVPKSAWAKTALATAACLALLLVTSALVDLNIQSTRAGFFISFGDSAPSENNALTQAQTEAIIQQIRQENTAILTEYAGMLNQHNQQQLQQVVEYFERQRLNDLQVIDEAFDEYQEQTETQLQQTNQVLGEVIQTVATND